MGKLRSESCKTPYNKKKGFILWPHQELTKAEEALNVEQALKSEEEKEKKELLEEMFLLDEQVLVAALLEEMVAFIRFK